MRDAHLLKEKFQLSLDNRQIASLVVGGLVVLGVVFGAGVVVGRKLAPPPVASESGPTDILAEVDKKSFDAAKELTYNESLTRPAPKTEAPAPKPVAKADPPPAPKPERVEPATPAATTSPEVRTTAPVQLSVRAPQPEAKSAPASTKASKDELFPGQPGEDEAPAHTKTPTTTTAAAMDRLQAFPDLVSQTKGGKGDFTLQISSSQDKGEADGVASKLKSSGYSPYIVDAQIPGKGRWFRVRLGHFGTKADAEKYLKDFKRETRIDAIVTASR